MIRLLHVSDPSRNMSAQSLPDAHAMIARAGGYPVRVNADQKGVVMWSDFPRHNPLTRTLDIPPLNPHTLGLRFSNN
jgi:hypothetical protein